MNKRIAQVLLKLPDEASRKRVLDLVAGVQKNRKQVKALHSKCKPK